MFNGMFSSNVNGSFHDRGFLTAVFGGEFLLRVSVARFFNSSFQLRGSVRADLSSEVL